MFQGYNYGEWEGCATKHEEYPQSHSIQRSRLQTNTAVKTFITRESMDEGDPNDQGKMKRTEKQRLKHLTMTFLFLHQGRY